MQRRTFIKTGTALSAAALTFQAPMLLGTEDKSDSKPLVVGKG
ncbi:MAG: hypothetical protein ACK47R_15000, partial [Planctomycetia bacterium]